MADAIKQQVGDPSLIASHGTWAEIDSTRTILLNTDCRRLLDWSLPKETTAKRPTLPVVFRLLAGGVVVGLLRTPELEAAIKVVEESPEPDVRLALGLVALRGSLEPTGNLVLPPAAIAHVLGEGRQTGVLFVYGSKSRLELWPTAYALKRVSEANDLISDLLPS